MCLTTFVLTTGFILAGVGLGNANETPFRESQTSKTADESDKAILELSKQKWTWMADKNVVALEGLFHEKSLFTHMGGTWDRKRELEIIKSGGIHYKKADIEESSVRVIGNTAIVMNRIRLLAVVGGNEVTNPFMVTEVYVRQDEKWQLVQLSFSRLVGA